MSLRDLRSPESTATMQGQVQVDVSNTYSHNPPPICHQFWKAGNYDPGHMSTSQLKNGKTHVQVHPMFLHSNATSHKWVFGAVAELIDNAVDEVAKGATFVIIDKIINPRDGSPALLIRDDGGGMNPESLIRCMSFGFSDKKEKSAIGQYGNGFKTSTMRLGADAIVFTCQLNDRKLTQSIGLLSYTFLRQACYDKVVVPMVDYMLNLSAEKFEPILPHGQDHFSANLSMILQWSPYSTEEVLMEQFDELGFHGTKVVVYNLWLNDDGDMELDFDSDVEDIRVKTDSKLLHTNHHSNPVADQHMANLYRSSLRASIITTIGYLKEAPHVNIHGFNVYHKNHLILPFWCVVNSHYGRGVVGVLETNYIQPTHNKQDFEKTSLFQKLEARLMQMTMEYWSCHCRLIGYQQMRNPSPAPKPSKDSKSSKFHTNFQPVVLDQNVTSVQEMHSKRKQHNPEVELEHRNKHRNSSSGSADSHLNQEKQQPTHGNEDQFQEEQLNSVMQENRRLRIQLLELEKNEEGLNMKVQQLKVELGDVQFEYANLLLESQAMNIAEYI